MNYESLGVTSHEIDLKHLVRSPKGTSAKFTSPHRIGLTQLKSWANQYAKHAKAEIRFDEIKSTPKNHELVIHVLKQGRERDARGRK